MSWRPDCIFEVHQLWQSGFSRVYSNCCWSCSFEPEIIKISQSSHKMYSNNIVKFQESTTILNACTKKSGNLLNTPPISVWSYLSIYLSILLFIYPSILIFLYLTRLFSISVFLFVCQCLSFCLWYTIFIIIYIYIYIYIYVYITFFCFTLSFFFLSFSVYSYLSICQSIYLFIFLKKEKKRDGWVFLFLF